MSSGQGHHQRVIGDLERAAHTIVVIKIVVDSCEGKKKG